MKRRGQNIEEPKIQKQRKAMTIGSTTTPSPMIKRRK